MATKLQEIRELIIVILTKLEAHQQNNDDILDNADLLRQYRISSSTAARIPNRDDSDKFASENTFITLDRISLVFGR